MTALARFADPHLPAGVTQRDIDGPLAVEPLQADAFDPKVSRALGDVIAENADDLAANLVEALQMTNARARDAAAFVVLGQMRAMLSKELERMGYRGLPQIRGVK